MKQAAGGAAGAAAGGIDGYGGISDIGVGSPIHDIENPYCPSPRQHQSTSHDPNPGASSNPSPTARRSCPTHDNSPLLSPPVLQADDLCVVYPTPSRDPHLALKGVTFALQPGEKVALMGMNGGGKSTLFRTLALGETTPCDGK